MNEQCPHLDYGKSADKALGAYCTAKKKLVEDCEGCEVDKAIEEVMQGIRGGILNAISKECKEEEEG